MLFRKVKDREDALRVFEKKLGDMGFDTSALNVHEAVGPQSPQGKGKFYRLKATLPDGRRGHFKVWENGFVEPFIWE